MHACRKDTALKVHDLLAPREQRDFTKSVFDAVAYSALFFVLFFPVTRLILSDHFRDAHVFLWVLLWFLLFLLIPAVSPFLLRIALSSKWLTRWFPHPESRAWDYVFRNCEACWITVHLKDLRKIGGWFGCNSFASSHPAEPQIYLEEAWKLDENGDFIEKVNQTKGILIQGSEIMAIQFFRYTGTDARSEER